MSWLPTTICTLFICIASPAILALNQSIPDGLVSKRSYSDDNQVPIHYYGDGFICTGTYITPWILMTAGSCVEGRNPKLFYVIITPPSTSNGFKKEVVGVHNYEIDPYTPPIYEVKKFALMVIQVSRRWPGGWHSMPNHIYTVKELRVLRVIQREWECSDFYGFGRVSRSFPVEQDFGLCGCVKDFVHWYCVYRNSQNYAYGQMDLGNSLVYKKRNGENVLLGVYLGYYLNRAVGGNFFQMTYWVRNWVNDFKRRYPNPPSY